MTEDEKAKRLRRAAEVRDLHEDPLGYDTSDIWKCAKAMSEAAQSGRNRPYVQAEIEAVEKRLLGIEQNEPSQEDEDMGFKP